MNDLSLRGLSIVVPTLNAARLLPGTLAAFGVQPAPAAADITRPDIIVVDGGSNDGTPAVAAAHGARVVTAPRGRGNQLAAGVQAGHGPWLLLLHADTRLSPGWRDAVARHMADHPHHAGYFRFRLHTTAPQARRLERLVAWRCRVLGLPYGDQGLLIHRDLLAAVGGIAPIPLMEDVDLVRRLGRRRLVMLPACAVTSAERWEREGYWRRSARNVLCLSLWFAGVPPRLIRRIYA